MSTTKPRRRRMAELIIDETSSVDSPAQKGALAVLLKRDEGGESLLDRLMKGHVVLVTDAADDHAHALHIWDGDLRGGETSHAGAPGEEGSHPHAWTLDPQTGRITIAMNRGHTHTVDPSAIFEMLLATAKGAGYQGGSDEDEEVRRRRRAAAMKSGEFGILDEDELELAAASIAMAGHVTGDQRAHIQKRADELGCPDVVSGLDDLPEVGYPFDSKSDASPDGGRTTMDPKELQAQLEAATKRADASDALLKSVLSLTPDAFAHYSTLNEAGRERFVALSKADQSAELEVAKAANAVVYTDQDGNEYRKSDDPRLVSMAKSRDEERKATAEALAKAETASFEKRAGDELGKLSGELGTRVAILKAVEGIEDEATRKAALETLKAANHASAGGFQTIGTSSTPAGDASAGDELDALAKSIAARDKISEAEGYAKAVQTPEGKALYAKHSGQPVN